MSKKHSVVVMLVIFLSISVVASAQNLIQNPKVLVVDETESMELSLRVQGLVSAMQSREGIEVTGIVSKVDRPLQNPLQGKDQQKFDAVIIVPHTIETGRIRQVWIVTRHFAAIPLEMRSQASQMLSELKRGINEAFSGGVTAVGVNDDAIPAYFSTLFQREGVFR